MIKSISMFYNPKDSILYLENANLGVNIFNSKTLHRVKTV